MNVSQGMEPMTPQLKSSMLTIVHSLLFSFHILSVFLKSTNYCTNRACQAFPTNEKLPIVKQLQHHRQSSAFLFLIKQCKSQQSFHYQMKHVAQAVAKTWCELNIKSYLIFTLDVYETNIIALIMYLEFTFTKLNPNAYDYDRVQWAVVASNIKGPGFEYSDRHLFAVKYGWKTKYSPQMMP